MWALEMWPSLGGLMIISCFEDRYPRQGTILTDVSRLSGSSSTRTMITSPSRTTRGRFRTSTRDAFLSVARSTTPSPNDWTSSRNSASTPDRISSQPSKAPTVLRALVRQPPRRRQARRRSALRAPIHVRPTPRFDPSRQARKKEGSTLNRS